MPKISETEWLVRKRRIVDTAFELFSKYGYSQVSVNDIVKNANISKGGFYTYFQSKQEIFYEILRESDMRKSAMIPKDDNAKGAAQKLYAYLKSRLLAFTEEENQKWIKFSVEFWSMVKHDEDYKQMNERRYGQFHKEIGGLIQDGISEGDFRKDLDLDTVIYMMISMIDGIAFMTSVMNHPLDEVKMEAAIELFLGYLASPMEPSTRS